MGEREVWSPHRWPYGGRMSWPSVATVVVGAWLSVWWGMSDHQVIAVLATVDGDLAPEADRG